MLYEADTKETAPGAVLADFPIDPDPFAADLVAGVGKRQVDIDEVIGRFAKDWSIDRMPVVDRNLLRIGVYELLERPDVPVAAVISEAVELAQRYSTEESGRFINGMLGRIAEEVRPER
ncbi:MAG: transcription antitermination factor NusB [Acidimicrobiia bacterium]|nr:transcription antitermination factor NusB [Acidimicrobiia bacterium]